MGIGGAFHGLERIWILVDGGGLLEVIDMDHFIVIVESIFEFLKLAIINVAEDVLEFGRAFLVVKSPIGASGIASAAFGG